jgi:hypothetical protein
MITNVKLSMLAGGLMIARATEKTTAEAVLSACLDNESV